MDSNRIVLNRTNQGWIAEYCGPHAAEIQRLFGTTAIPTAFTERALPAVVKREIQRLNPDAEVYMVAL